MKQSLLKDEKYRSLFAVLSATGWSLAYPLIKLGYREFQIPSDDIGGKILFAGIRFLCAGLLLLGYSFSQKRKPGKLGSNEWTWLVLFALVNITFHYMFAYIGLGYIPGSRGTILDSMGGFLLILLAAWVYPDAQSMRSKWIGCVLGIAGIVLINWNPGHSFFFRYQLERRRHVIVECVVFGHGRVDDPPYIQKDGYDLCHRHQYGFGWNGDDPFGSFIRNRSYMGTQYQRDFDPVLSDIDQCGLFRYL